MLRWSTYNPNYIPAWSLRDRARQGYFEEVGFDEIEYILAQETSPGMIGGSIDIAHHDTEHVHRRLCGERPPIKIITHLRARRNGGSWASARASRPPRT